MGAGVRRFHTKIRRVATTTGDCYYGWLLYGISRGADVGPKCGPRACASKQPYHYYYDYYYYYYYYYYYWGREQGDHGS